MKRFTLSKKEQVLLRLQNVKCSKGLIVELWVNLKGDINKDDNISRLLQNTPVVNNVSCERGMIDTVGF